MITVELHPGDKLGRYVIEAFLGEGGMGRVYRAKDEQLERRVALKLLRLDASNNEQSQARARGRLLQEARAAASIDNPHAVAIYDVGEVEGSPFISMELVDGQTLRTYVGDATVPVETRVRWLAEIAEALQAAHDRGLIHRDVKPENVMIRRDGATKVLDFGIAQQKTKQAPAGAAMDLATLDPLTVGGATNQTHQSITGTPLYMAPEQLRGDPLDARTDQFAWGVLAYELLTGRVPWSGETASFTFVLTVLERPPEIPPLAEACSADVAAVVLRALAKDREERFPSMRDLAGALSGKSAARSTGASRGRGRARAWIGVGVLCAVIAGGIGIRAAMRKTRAPIAAAASALIVPESTSARPAPAPTKLTDLPPPSSVVPEAQAAYAAGIQLIHDASIIPGLKQLRRAADLDPSLAAAFLRLLTYGAEVTEGNAPNSFAKARELSPLLSARDQKLLTAWEPGYLATPADDAEVTKRLRALADEMPADAELQYLIARRSNLDADTAKIYLDRALTIDPDFALALWFRAQTRLFVGDVSGALEALDRCVAVSPSSTACRTVRALQLEAVGRCDDMEQDARAVALLAPSGRSLDLVARALMAKGAPIAAVRDALERKWAATTDPETREDFRLDDEAHLAILAGDLSAAERFAKKAVAREVLSTSEDDHHTVVVPLIDLYVEEGRRADAARLADEFMQKRASWTPEPLASPVPFMMAILVDAKLRTEDERKRAVDEWAVQWNTVDGPYHLQWWIYGHAVAAVTGADARDALAIAPDPLPLPHTNQFQMSNFGANGRVLYLADRYDDALPYLRNDAASCTALVAPMQQTRAHLWLGEVLEQNGDRDGACAAYRVVIDRWGKTTSVSAARATDKSRALACP
jgi:serine/threonine-protein kinase